MLDAFRWGYAYLALPQVRRRGQEIENDPRRDDPAGSRGIAKGSAAVKNVDANTSPVYSATCSCFSVAIAKALWPARERQS